VRGPMREAGQADVPELAGLMRAFYAESGFTLDEEQAAAGFKALLADARLGRVWLMAQGPGAAAAEDVAAAPDEPAPAPPAAGYIVVTSSYATEPEELIAFYSHLFGWTFTRAEGMEYWLIGTGSPDEPGIDGGLVKRPVPGPPDSPALNAFSCTVQVDSVDGSLEKAGELGAEVALPRMAVGGVGWLAYIKDPDGNLLGLLESDPTAA
jgi:uncharacterized protein